MAYVDIDTEAFKAEAVLEYLSREMPGTKFAELVKEAIALKVHDDLIECAVCGSHYDDRDDFMGSEAQPEGWICHECEGEVIEDRKYNPVREHGTHGAYHG